jgi:predicted nucleic acid-binding protein
MGPADAACVAYALAEQAVLATDDGRMQREVREHLGPNRVVSTPGVLLAAIRSRRITVEEADAFKETLARNRFVMSFGSFQEKVDS